MCTQEHFVHSELRLCVLRYDMQRDILRDQVQAQSQTYAADRFGYYMMVFILFISTTDFLSLLSRYY